MLYLSGLPQHVHEVVDFRLDFGGGGYGLEDFVFEGVAEFLEQAVAQSC